VLRHDPRRDHGVEQLISVDPVFTAPDNTGPAPAPQSSAAATPHPAAGTATPPPPPPQNISGELEYLTNELLIVPAGTLIGR
jgi:hypothetical protein